MKKFFKKLFFILGIVFASIIAIGIISFIVFTSNQKASNKQCSTCILEISIKDGLAEKTQKLDFISKLMGEKEAVSFTNSLDLIQKACDDSSIKAISIDGSSSISYTQAVSLSKALQSFSEDCDKPIFAYGDYYTQSAFLLSLHADSTFIHPMGTLTLTGFKAILNYYKDFLDRWDIQMEIYKAGKFKGYVEAFNRTSPSPENEMQYKEILQSRYTELLDILAASSEKDTSFWNTAIQNDFGARAQKLIEENMIHSSSYETNYKVKISEKFDLKQQDFLSLSSYKARQKSNSKKSNVAYIVMEGDIDKKDSGISSEELKKELRKIRKSDQYKAVILRVNSGGGSAFASDDIWHEVNLIKEKGIPVIASVGNVAASGGYYIIMNSDKIFAQQNSIVGSIGVFIIFPQLQDGLKKHVGIDFAEISTSPYSKNLSLLTDLSPEMKSKLQNETDFIYENFITKVAEGRSLNKEAVKDIAQGRVYSGSKAKEIGLIDDIKSLNEVKDYIKETYELDYVKLDEIPKKKNSLLPSQLQNIFAKSSSNEAEQILSKIADSQQLLYKSLQLEPRMEWLGIDLK